MENNPNTTSTTTPWYTESAVTDTPRTGEGTQFTGQGTQPADDLKQQAQQVVQQIPQKAGQLATQARDQVKSQVATQKERAAGGLESVAQALRETGQHLEEQNQAKLGDYAENIADQVERFSGYLRQKDVDQLLREAENFARRQPALFLGTAFALGFMAARFLKSSGRNGGWEEARYERASMRTPDVGYGTASMRTTDVAYEPASALRTDLLPTRTPATAPAGTVYPTGITSPGSDVTVATPTDATTLEREA